MEPYTESYCLAILVTNLKHRKRYPDSIVVAECAEFLYKMYGSFEKVAEMVDTHASVIRKWVNLATAPDFFRQCVKDNMIYPVAAFAILAAFKDNDKRIAIAKEVSGWGEPEIVRFLKFIKDNPRLSVSECKKRFLGDVLGKLIVDTKTKKSD